MKERGLLLAIVGLLLCASPGRAEEPVKIGLITTLSGPAGYLGQDIRDGFQLAVDAEGGKLGGVAVKVIVDDDDLKPGLAKQFAEHLMQDEKVKLFTGIVFSNVAEATVPEILDGGNLYVSANAAPSNFAGKDCNKNYFVISWQNDVLHEAAGKLANELGYKRAFILAPNYQAGKDALAGFKRYFRGDIVGELYTKLDQTDFSAEMAQIRAAHPDMVFQFQPGGLGIAFMRQYQEAGLLAKIPMVAPEPSADQVILNAVGDASIGLSVAAHWNYDLPNPANHTFVSAWKAKYDRPLTYYASQGYDTALAFAAALKATKGDVDDMEAFRQAFARADFQSVRGAFRFGPNQHPVQDWYALQVIRGEDGQPALKVLRKIMSDQGDSYSVQCKL